jgi:aminoglycoside phosphotransferase (APT) family kinase protein
LERSAVLDTRTHQWARADRLAWGDEQPGEIPALVAALLERVRPVDRPAQIVHGDLGGNVLFASGLDPAVIDFSPYWRPPGWALAIVVVDAVVWGRAGFDLVDALDPDDREQLLARATLFRLFCGEASGPHERWVAHLCRLLDGAT